MPYSQMGLYPDFKQLLNQSSGDNIGPEAFMTARTAKEMRSKSALDQLQDAPKQRMEIYRGFAGQDNKQPKLPAQVFS